MRDLEFLKTERARGAVRRLSPPVIQLVAQVAFWGCALVVAYLAFLPSTDSPGASWDKANHLVAFAVMAWLADLAWRAQRHAILRWGLLLGYGLLIETVQHFLPLRHFSLLDWVADGLGVLMYLGLKASCLHYQCLRILKPFRPLALSWLRSRRKRATHAQG